MTSAARPVGARPAVPRRSRRSIRLAGFDYTSPGFYFVTICATRRLCLFGDIRGGSMELSERGRIVAACWEDLPNHHPGVQVDAFVVMPNHVHGIIVLAGEDAGTAGRAPTAGGDAPVQDPAGRAPTAAGAVPVRGLAGGSATSEAFGRPVPGSLSTVMRSFKAATAKRVNETVGRLGTPLWQPDYYEHVVRDAPSLDRIREYLATNVERWSLDAENPRRTGEDEFDRWLSSLPPRRSGEAALGIAQQLGNRVAPHG